MLFKMHEHVTITKTQGARYAAEASVFDSEVHPNLTWPAALPMAEMLDAWDLGKHLCRPGGGHVVPSKGPPASPSGETGRAGGGG